MTENEAIKVLEEKKHVKIITIDGEPTLCYTTDMVKAFETAIKALEEIKQYRELGTVELLIKSNAKALSEQMELKQYKAIGTIEEFKALKEKNMKKRFNIFESHGM